MPSPNDLWSYIITLPDGRTQPAKDIISWSDRRHNLLSAELAEVKATLAEILKRLPKS